MMPGKQLKKRPLSRYLKDYKHSQTHCSQCEKVLDRMALVFRGKIINKEAIARMDQPIDDLGLAKRAKRVDRAMPVL